jgi:hypothetical protein
MKKLYYKIKETIYTRFFGYYEGPFIPHAFGDSAKPFKGGAGAGRYERVGDKVYFEMKTVLDYYDEGSFMDEQLGFIHYVRIGIYVDFTNTEIGKHRVHILIFKRLFPQCTEVQYANIKTESSQVSEKLENGNQTSNTEAGG